MKKIINCFPRVSLEPLNEIARGYEISQLLFLSLDYDIFRLLRKPRTAKYVSKKIQSDSYLTEAFLNTLVALNLLSKVDNKYLNTTLSNTFLVKGKQFYQGNLIKLKRKSFDFLLKLKHGLKSKEIQEGYTEEINRQFILGNAEGAISGDIQRALKKISSLSLFKKAKKLLDLGGGHGLYSIALAQMKKDLEIIVFDLPHVIKITKEFVKKYNMQRRIKLVSGDFTKDDFGKNYDIIFASDVAISNIIRKIYQSLKQNGALIYRRWVLNDDKTGPLVAALFEFMLSVRGYEHHVYSLKEYIDELSKAGFRKVRAIDVSTPSDPTNIIIANK
ncbi:MAG: methyltransferase [Candidatus Edwardsbacteria bacterium]